MKKYWLLPICLLLIFSLLGCNAKDDDDDDSDSRKGNGGASGTYVTPNSESDFEWEYTDEGLVITRYVGKSTTVVVPETIENKKVISVGNTFVGNVKIETVVLPTTIKTLYLEAFKDCDALVRIEALGATVVEKAKQEIRIKELALPALIELSLDSIKCCKGLEYLSIPNIDNVIMYYCDSFPANLKEVVIPENMMYVPYDAVVLGGTPLYSKDSGDDHRYAVEITSENEVEIYCKLFKTDNIIVNGERMELLQTYTESD